MFSLIICLAGRNYHIQASGTWGMDPPPPTISRFIIFFLEIWGQHSISFFKSFWFEYYTYTHKKRECLHLFPQRLSTSFSLIVIARWKYYNWWNVYPLINLLKILPFVKRYLKTSLKRRIYYITDIKCNAYKISVSWAQNFFSIFFSMFKRWRWGRYAFPKCL